MVREWRNSGDIMGEGLGLDGGERIEIVNVSGRDGVGDI